jgi:AcrR family transcriptional regulator
MDSNEIQQQILKAAERRFNVYGYQKTTMAEVAGDCAMSAANLYRYFDNKLAIGAALATQCLAENESLLAELVYDDNLSSSEKLTAFTMKQLHYTYDYFESAPKLAELVEVMTTQRPDVIETHRQHKLLLLDQLLVDGQQSGEFVFGDLMETKDAVHSATLLFYFPLTMSLFPLAVLEQKATRVCQLLLRGLKSDS